MPRARAPSMSSAYESPTITVSGGGDPESRERASRRSRRAASCGRGSSSRRRRRRRGVVARELLEVALAVRDQADPSPCARSDCERRQGIVVEVEVGMNLPAPHHVDRAGTAPRGVAAHPADDVLGEGDPDLLVVHELGVRPADPSSAASRAVLVARRVEVEPVRRADAPVRLRPELGPGPREREVDVEENRAQHAPRIGTAADAHRRPAEAGFARREATASTVPCFRGLAMGNPMGSSTRHRGAQIRTGDLSDPNGARYQAAPHPERPQGTGSAASRRGRSASAPALDCARGRQGRDRRVRERAARGRALAGVRAARAAGGRRRGGDAPPLRRLELAGAVRACGRDRRRDGARPPRPLLAQRAARRRPPPARAPRGALPRECLAPRLPPRTRRARRRSATPPSWPPGSERAPTGRSAASASPARSTASRSTSSPARVRGRGRPAATRPPARARPDRAARRSRPAPPATT